MYDDAPPPSSCQAAYHVWHNLNMKEWKLDPDPLISARKLLTNATNTHVERSGDLPRVRTIEMSENEDYSCLAFSIPPILHDWSHRVKELVVDSACEYIYGQ